MDGLIDMSSGEIVRSLQASGESLMSIESRTRIPVGTLAALRDGQYGRIPAYLKSSGARTNIKKLLAVDIGLFGVTK